MAWQGLPSSWYDTSDCAVTTPRGLHGGIPLFRSDHLFVTTVTIPELQICPRIHHALVSQQDRKLAYKSYMFQNTRGTRYCLVLFRVNSDMSCMSFLISSFTDEFPVSMEYLTSN